MKFKEFSKWCNQRASDGCWGMIEAMTCIGVHNTIHKKTFWKREKIWHKVYEKSIVTGIVEPINKKIKEMEDE